MRRLRITIAALIYGVYVIIVTLYPFGFSRHSLNAFEFASVFAGSSSRDFIINVVLFIPFGVLFYYQLLLDRGKVSAILIATIIGSIVSLIIELLQVISFRNPSAFDVLSNTIGASTGALLAALLPSQIGRFAFRLLKKIEASGTMLCLALLFGAIPLILSFVQFGGPFYIWNSRFTFQLGNEATLDRPWLGKIFLVALYSRALSADEVESRFYQGFVSNASKKRMSGDLVALYTFSEKSGHVVHDTSGFGPALDLNISPEGHVRWLASSGIEIVRPAVVKSQKAGTKLVKAVRANHELSIEAWMAPYNTTQGGLARIVSFSQDPMTRNFTVGQEGPDIHFRLRSPVGIIGGDTLALKTTNAFTSAEPAHIVATYEAGIQRMYVNGVEQPESLNLITTGIVGFGTAKSVATRIAYSFFYFFPVSFIFSVFFSIRFGDLRNSLLTGASLGVGLLMITEIFQGFAFDRAVDVRLLGYGLFIAVIAAFSGSAFATGDLRQILAASSATGSLKRSKSISSCHDKENSKSMDNHA